MGKPQTVSRRAQSYASTRVLDWSNGQHGALSSAWAAGYRAAMRDARKAWQIDGEDACAVTLSELIHDYARLK